MPANCLCIRCVASLHYCLAATALSALSALSAVIMIVLLVACVRLLAGCASDVCVGEQVVQARLGEEAAKPR